MQFALQVVSWGISLPLQLLVIAALLRGHYQRYPLFFLYCIVAFLSTVIEISVNAAYYAGAPGFRGIRVRWYWINEGIYWVLIFALVISLIYHATKDIKPRRIVRISIVAGAVLYASISFLSNYRSDLVVSAWMTPWSRDLNFCSAILDLALWAMLISSREKDRRLLLLSGSLGIQFTCEAIGEAVRSISGVGGVWAGNILMATANVAVLYIWWRTFRPKPVTKAVTA